MNSTFFTYSMSYCSSVSTHLSARLCDDSIAGKLLYNPIRSVGITSHQYSPAGPAQPRIVRNHRALGLGAPPAPLSTSCCNNQASFPTIHIFQVTMASSSSNFQSMFNSALEAYEKATKNKLLTHPLAAQLQSCDSPNAILSVLKNLIQQSDQRSSSDERLRNWLDPTVSVLYTFSATIGGGVGLVIFNIVI